MLKVANSVIDASRITGVLPVVNGGTGVTTSTGTGNTVLSAAPTLSGNVNLSTGNLVIGTAGKGIDFSVTTSGSGTMTSELLADYEEGTWTPTISSGATGITYAAQIGFYTKIGRQVIFNLNLITSAATATADQFKIGGLPFAAVTIGGAYFMYASAFTGSTTINLPTGYVLANIDFYKTDSSSFLGTDVSTISGFNIHMSGQYTA